MQDSGIVKLFAPAVNLMKKFRYPQKFAIMSCSILALVGGIIFLFMSNLQPQIDFNEKENLGVEYITPVKDFLYNVQLHRDLTNSYLSGNFSVRSEIADVEANIETDINKIDAIDKKLNSTLVVENKYESLKTNWNNLKSSYRSLNIKNNFDKHTAIINDSIALISHLCDKSNLTLDPDLDSYYMMDAFGFKLPNLLEKLALAKIEGQKIIISASADKTELIKLSTLFDEVNELTNGGKDVIFNYNPSLKEELGGYFNDAYSSNKKSLSLINKLIVGSAVSKSDYISSIDNSLKADKVLYDKYSEYLYKLIDKRVKKYTDQIPVALFFTLLVSALIGYLFAGFYLCLTDSLKNIEAASKKVEQGDLTIRIKLDCKDEIYDLSNIMNNIFGNLNRIVVDLFNTSNEIKLSSGTTYQAAENTLQGAEQTSQSTSQLAHGAQDISRNVEDGAANISKMNTVIQGIYEEAKVVAKLGNDTEVNANTGAQYVKNAVNKMDSIKKVSEEISVNISELGQLSSEIEQIVDLIKNIAGQTNLLALNAAIEAARAGEHGKGFAVVSDEVKKLADQSAEATEKITEMIKEIQNKTGMAVSTMDKATKEVEEGVYVINDAGKSLENIITQVKTANIKIQEITKEVDGAARNSEEIVQMIENISAVTEETAAGAEEISSISEQQNTNVSEITKNAQTLAKIAEDLNKQFSVYKI